jgi:hypothetical protein
MLPFQINLDVHNVLPNQLVHTFTPKPVCVDLSFQMNPHVHTLTPTLPCACLSFQISFLKSLHILQVTCDIQLSKQALM